MKSDLKRLQEAAEEVGGRVRTYSGRFMYGEECLAISGADSTACIKAATDRGIRGARTDTLGKDTIVYWPGVPVPEGFEE